MVMSKTFYRISNNRELSLLYPNNAKFEISENLGKSSLTYILLAEEQTTKKPKYIKH